MLFSHYRPEGAADVRYAEGSMKNGFGLVHLHKFLSIPFLQLQVYNCNYYKPYPLIILLLHPTEYRIARNIGGN